MLKLAIQILHHQNSKIIQKYYAFLNQECVQKHHPQQSQKGCQDKMTFNRLATPIVHSSQPNPLLKQT
jgi:hypothetical protein